MEKGVDIGPITNRSHLEKINGIIGTVEQEGGKLLLDGRGANVKGYEKGNWVGPTIITNMTTSMTCYTEEIFGPAMCVLTANTLDEALTIINR